MRATGPTARPAHPVAHFIEADLDPAVSGVSLLRRRHPADPLIARQRRDIRPDIPHHTVRADGFAKIRWHFVHRFFFGHFLLYRRELRFIV